MSRAIPAAVLTALGQTEVEPFFALRLNYDGGAFDVWTGYGDRVIDGNTFIGVGDILQIDGLSEVADMSATSVTVSVDGVDSNIISAALSSPYQGRSATIWFGVVGVADVVEVFSGFMDVMTIQDSGDAARIAVTIESKLVSLQRSKGLRYTSQSHQARNGTGFSTDTFFDYTAELADKEILWGRTDENK